MVDTVMLEPDVVRLIEDLRLAEHPEGGFYRETYRSPVRIPTPRGERSALTIIHFVLPVGAMSAFHRVASDEVWIYSGGDALELHMVSPEGAHSRVELGPGGHAVVPAGHWQAARPAGSRFAHVTCVVAPGFEFADFELARRSDFENELSELPFEVLELVRP